MEQILNDVKIEMELWAKFTTEAKRARKKPARLLTELLSDYLDLKERERLTRETVATMSDRLSEDDDIERMIRDYRKQRRAKA